jgi:hypothetical protein
VYQTVDSQNVEERVIYGTSKGVLTVNPGDPATRTIETIGVQGQGILGCTKVGTRKILVTLEQFMQQVQWRQPDQGASISDRARSDAQASS